MRLQCERCATVYELDDARVPAGGASVQCTRCGHVFRAVPARAEGDRTWLGQPPPLAPMPEPAGPGDAGRTAVFVAREAAPAAASPGEGPRADGQGVPPAGGARRGREAGDGEPTAAPAAGAGEAGRAGSARGPLPDRPRRRWPWLLLAIAVALAIFLLAGCSLFRSRVDPRATALRDEAHAALAHDDQAHLELAARRLAEASAADPGWVAARADRALVLLLQADDLAEAARPLERSVLGLDAEVARLEAERPPDWQARRDAVAERSRVARREAGSSRERARALTAEARASLEALAEEAGDAPEVARARALLQGLGGDAAGAARLAPRPPAGSPPDPWATIALAMATLRRRDGVDAPGSAGAADAASALDALVARRPEMLRARVVLAGALATSGRRDDAVAALDAVMLANPEHERARALKAEILSPPPVALNPVAIPRVAPPPQRPGHLPRLPSAEAARGKGTPARASQRASRPPSASAAD